MRQAGQDAPKLVSGGSEQRVDLVAGHAEEIVSPQSAVVLGVADNWLDRLSIM